VSVARSSFEGGVDQASALRRSVGRKLLFRTSPKDTVSATVLGVDPERYLFADGSVSFSAPGMPLFPKDVVTVEPELRLSVKSPDERKSLARAHRWRELGRELPGDPRRQDGAGGGAAVVRRGR
jgi:hypothetical protein